MEGCYQFNEEFTEVRFPFERGNEIDNVRIGKHITLEITAGNKDEAREKVDLACKKLLANPIMEGYEFELAEVK